MQIILITPTPKYSTLIPSTKTIESTTVDIVSLIQTQVFLNHHYNISFFCIRNNFPYQFHCPLKISKQLLDRNQGAVELFISNGMYFKIQADTDMMEILSNVQNSLQGVQSQQNVVFMLHFWEIQIKLYILNQPLQQKKIKQSIKTLQSTPISTTFPSQPQPQPQSPHKPKPPPELSKVILYIDDTNYEQFLAWSQNDPQLHDFKLNEKLSHQYMQLKQQIDNQKNNFRNKIKMVQAILGENINIDKLLSQEKEENQEYKRLRETFQTIKNIDNVLVEQERKLEDRREEFKGKREEKHRVHYQKARVFAAKKKELAVLGKEVQVLKYKLECVMKERSQYHSKRSFQYNSPQVKTLLNSQVQKYHQILKNINTIPTQPQPQPSQLSPQSQPPQSQAQSPQPQSPQLPQSKPRTLQSMHKANKKQIENYQNLLKKRVHQANREREEKEDGYGGYGGNGRRKCKEDREKIGEDMRKFQVVLRELWGFYRRNCGIVAEIADREGMGFVNNGASVAAFPNISHSFHIPKSSTATSTPTHTRTPSLKSPQKHPQPSQNPSPSSPSPCPVLPNKSFIVLTELLQKKSQYDTLIAQNKQNETHNNNNKITSNSSINQKFGNQEDNRMSRVSRVSQVERSSFYKYSMSKIGEIKGGNGVNGGGGNGGNGDRFGKNGVMSRFNQGKVPGKKQ